MNTVYAKKHQAARVFRLYCSGSYLMVNALFCLMLRAKRKITTEVGDTFWPGLGRRRPQIRLGKPLAQRISMVDCRSCDTALRGCCPHRITPRRLPSILVNKVDAAIYSETGLKA